MNIIAVFALTIAGWTSTTFETATQPQDLNAGPCDPAVSRCL